MKNNPDIKKVVRQHAEMAEFFSGGLTVKKPDDVKTEDRRQNKLQVTRHRKKRDQPHQQRQSKSLRKSPKRFANAKNADSAQQEPTRSRAKAIRQPELCLSAKAPGADEDAQGRPFVGRAGQLLDKIITACGLKREDVWIGNILKCRPPDNRDPRPEEIIACLPYLQRQIELINPEIIVALGAHAAKTLLNTPKPIGQLRGMFHEYVPGIGKKPIKLMPTFHPAYLLRNYSDDNRRKVWEDMKKVLAEFGLPVPQKPDK